MKRIRKFLFKDVQNEDESNRPAIVLRLASIGVMIYCMLLALGVTMSHSASMLMFTIPFFLLYGFVFWLTYKDRLFYAALFFNLFTLLWIVLCLYNFGWDVGAQHFLFVLMLIDFFLPYSPLYVNLIGVALMCVLRICLFFYCKFYAPQISYAPMVVYYYQVVNTICIFGMISMCGCMISKNFMAMENKLIETNKKLRYLAQTDPLTKLMNRLCMVEYVNELLGRERREGSLSVAIGDIDLFKKFNDTYGHECGDVVLKQLSAMFQEYMEPYGAVARWGGEEFLFLFKKSNGDEAYVALTRLLDKIRGYEITYGDLQLAVTMSFGLVEIDQSRPFDDSIREADHLLYRAKESGRNKIVY